MVDARGVAFGAGVDGVRLERIDDADHVLARVMLRPPSAASATRLVLRCDVILHRVVTHKIFVLLRRDPERGLFNGEAQQLGILRYQHTSLPIERAGASRWRLISAMFTLGCSHIVEGKDHLLFVLLLVLPAPLIAVRRRWSERRPLGATVRQVIAVVTAFTFGHSLTLALATLGVLQLSSRPVEVLIAVSILVSALHAMRPLFPGAEAWIAAGFGTMHGLAFSAALAELGLRGAELGLGLLSFNLGVEAMQLSLVVLGAPLIVLLSGSAAATKLRLAGATLGLAAALFWIFERV